MQLQEDIYICSKKQGVWQPIEALPYPINTEANEGSPCFSADGKYLFFVRCGERGGMGSCDIYYCVNTKGKWSKPILAPAPLNSKYWESTPCISALGNELYFASNRPGGKGKKDIWKCQITRNPNGTLQFYDVMLLEGSINTPYDEISPFLHANDSTLYFSSNGHYGMGRLDIFYSHRLGANEWSKPTNMGYPINTHSDEMGWIVSPDGETAYMASDSSLTGVSHKIIYQISLPKWLQPTPTTPQQLWDIQQSVTLHHIYFDFDKATLQPASEKELNQLVALILNNPNKTFTIIGHTDNLGNEAYNLALSKKRAESVVKYLIEKGIEPSRLISKGMGSSQPSESNATEWGRAKNRRIEVSAQ
jgi:outer membrane protein OmpA-like peptidoglycan-associated protein